MKSNFIIGVDVDGVLRDMDAVMMDIFKELYPEHVKSDIIYGWDFPNVELPQKRKMDIMFKEYPKEVFENSLPFEGVHDEYLKLNAWSIENGGKLACVTNQKPKLIHHTLIWLGKHKFNFDEIYFTKEKEDLAIDFLIDDSPKNFERWVKAGRDPKRYIIMDRDYNHDINATNRISRLSEAIQIIKFLMLKDKLIKKIK